MNATPTSKALWTLWPQPNSRTTLTQWRTLPSASASSATALSRSAAVWLRYAETRLADIARLPENWDRHGGKPGNPDTLAFARTLIHHIARENVPQPHIAPLAYGGVQLEWHRRGKDLEIELIEPYRVIYLYEDKAGSISDEGLLEGTDLTCLDNLIKKVSS